MQGNHHPILHLFPHAGYFWPYEFLNYFQHILYESFIRAEQVIYYRLEKVSALLTLNQINCSMMSQRNVFIVDFSHKLLYVNLHCSNSLIRTCYLSKDLEFNYLIKTESDKIKPVSVRI